MADKTNMRTSPRVAAALLLLVIILGSALDSPGSTILDDVDPQAWPAWLFPMLWQSATRMPMDNQRKANGQPLATH